MFLHSTRSEACFGNGPASVKLASELPSFSLSKLCIRQVPRLHVSISLGTFATCGTTTAKGLYANSFNELNHYAFGGIRAQALSVFVLSTSTTGSNRRVPPPRGSRLAPLLQGLPFSVFLSFLYGTRLLLFPRLPPTDPGGIRPFVLMYVVFVELTYARGIRQPGRLDVFPERDCVPLHTQVGLVLCCPQVLHRHVRDRLGRYGLRGGQVRSDFSSAWKGSSEILQEF